MLFHFLPNIFWVAWIIYKCYSFRNINHFCLFDRHRHCLKSINKLSSFLSVISFSSSTVIVLVPKYRVNLNCVLLPTRIHRNFMFRITKTKSYKYIYTPYVKLIGVAYLRYVMIWPTYSCMKYSELSQLGPPWSHQGAIFTRQKSGSIGPWGPMALPGQAYWTWIVNVDINREPNWDKHA